MALEVGQFEFFYTLYLVDGRAAELARGEREGGETRRRRRRARSTASPLPAADLNGHPLLSESTDQAFTKVFTDLLLLYRRVFEQMVCRVDGRPTGGSG